MDWKRIIKINYPQLFFVFAAFFLMVMVSYISISGIVRRYLILGVEEAMLTAEANIRAGLSESEATMNNAVHTVQGMLDGGASQEEVLTYLTDTTSWMRRSEAWMLGFYGVYGYIRGEFIDGIGLNPTAEFVPQTRSWFDTAVRNAENTTAYTEPYKDLRTGNIVMTSVRNIYGEEGEYYGIIAIDMDTSWFKEYVSSLQMGNGSYGVILNPYMMVVGHPKDEYISLQMHDIGGGYRELHDALISRQEIKSMRITDMDGIPAIASFKRMFNGWYIGVVTPFSSYYSDVYYTAVVLSVLGFVLMLCLSLILLRLSASKIHSDEENRSKSSFLARMSHEIRTPMNAIIGMSELAARDYGKPQGLEYIAGIKQAGANLLSIINDILDFSRIGSGNLPITNIRYEAASLFSDVLAIIKVRLEGKGIEFLTDIDPDIPCLMNGDEVRVRQILLNLLSNAVKYTESGFIKFSARCERKSEKTVYLTFIVEDSGIGIKSDDMERLFGDFSRVDEKRNRNIEGAGLGLSITRSLCLAMGGGVAVTSEYGKGSTFTARIRQIVANGKPMGSLNDKRAVRSEVGGVCFTAPNFRVMIVDDNATNLKVAEGLLAPYMVKVDTCESGEKSLLLIRRKRYDLVLMDHMMPDMDGIEAANGMRALGVRAPIVALTANAVSGMREMFLENGFDDFLSKPIEMAKLNELIEKWVPLGARKPKINEKDEPGETFSMEIDGVDAARGMAMTGGDDANYRSVLELYCRDAESRMGFLELAHAERDLKNFTTQVHAVKSASASIGAAAISQEAASLEDAGGRWDMEFIGGHIDGFREALSILAGNIRAALTPDESGVDEKKTAIMDRSALLRLKEALEAEDIGAVDGILDDLMGRPLGAEIKRALSGISDYLLQSEFDEAVSVADDLLREVTE
ncbi:MAG: response regulator [Synergistaceae bacterium]|jgi:signal transduction histidine kinase/CheY-like chemotaxis protein|nr:response regulator [Synergistaceae bacterium]